MTKGGVLLRKKEMTKLWVGDIPTPVTLLQVVPQEVVRLKTVENDGYAAVVLASGKKESSQEKGMKVSYETMAEFRIDDGDASSYADTMVSPSILEGIELVHIIGTTKGKGFQGVMKRHNAKGGQDTHGSKHHRTVGSVGNRKPRRTMKNHPHAGQMGLERQTLRNRKIVEVIKVDGDVFVAIKGSIPGSRNSIIKAYFA